MEVFTYLSFVLNIVLLSVVLGYRMRARKHDKDALRWQNAIHALRNVHAHREGLS
ncbi:MAG: hypothetical protein LBQ12_00910 [Deltaproteobacteria bacterium]|jgi:hypothetical protein|nr:hypothetical protein [Deltaproteobacteria bacterium]